MRQSQGQIGVISAPICAFCRRLFGGFSIVSVHACPLFSDSGSKLGQKLLGGKWLADHAVKKSPPKSQKSKNRLRRA